MELRPSIPAWTEHAADWRALHDGLVERGLDVELVEPPPPPEGGVPQVSGMDFALYLVDHLDDAMFTVLIEEVIRRVIRARRQRKDKTPVMGVIYGPDGEILKEVSIDEEGDHGPA